MGLFKSIKKAFKKVGSALKGTVGKVLAVAAMIAIPFIAAPIAGVLAGSAFLGSTVAAIGTTATSALVGAGLGAGVSALTGQNALMGAALGGAGGFLGAGGLSGLFGGSGLAGSAGAAVGAPATGAAGAGLTTLGAGATGGAGSILSAGTAAASTGLGSLLSSVSIGDLAPLAMTLFNKPPDQLTAEERAYLDETAQAAATNQELFRQRVTDAQSVRAAGPTPEQAYQRTAEAIDVQSREAERRAALTGSAGRGEFAGRQAAIARGAAGGLAAAQAGQQQVENIRTAAGLMPTGAPTDETAASRLAIARGREKQQQDYLGNVGTGVQRLFGGTASSRAPKESDDEEERKRRAGLTVGDMYNSVFG